MFNIFFTEKAQKELDKLTSSDTQKILRKLPLLSNWPSSTLNIKKLLNTPNFYRLRVDRVRIIFEIDFSKKQIWIRKIGYRGGVYR